jgi:hypothetical protein
VTKECETGLKSDIALWASEEEGPGESGLPLRVTCVRLVSENWNLFCILQARGVKEKGKAL